MKKVVILANGEYPKRKNSTQILQDCKYIIACDGAANKLIKKGINPYAVIGDLDSLKSKYKNNESLNIIHIDDQESNDLTKAFKFALTLNPSEILIFGATGKREDHTLGNISLMFEFSELTTVPFKMVTDFGEFLVISQSSSLKIGKNKHISLFSNKSSMVLENRGLKYQTNKVKFDLWWKATLNVTLEDIIEFRFNSGKLMIYIQS